MEASFGRGRGRRRKFIEIQSVYANSATPWIPSPFLFPPLSPPMTQSL